jgi:uncharacterized protein
MKKIGIKAGDAGIDIVAELYNTDTAEKIAGILPVKESVTLWGNEIYFPVNISLEEEPGAREILEAGELGYWPRGKVFCVFFGPTPVSIGNEPRAISNVNVFGKILSGFDVLKKVKQGDLIEVINIL